MLSVAGYLYFGVGRLENGPTANSPVQCPRRNHGITRCQIAAYSWFLNMQQLQAVRIMETMPTDDKKVATHARMSAGSSIMPTCIVGVCGSTLSA